MVRATVGICNRLSKGLLVSQPPRYRHSLMVPKMRNKKSEGTIPIPSISRTHEEHVEQLRAQIGQLTDHNLQLQTEVVEQEAQTDEYYEMIRQLSIENELLTQQLQFAVPIDRHEQTFHLIQNNSRNRYLDEKREGRDVNFPNLFEAANA